MKTDDRELNLVRSKKYW